MRRRQKEGEHPGMQGQMRGWRESPAVPMQLLRWRPPGPRGTRVASWSESGSWLQLAVKKIDEVVEWGWFLGNERGVGWVVGVETQEARSKKQEERRNKKKGPLFVMDRAD